MIVLQHTLAILVPVVMLLVGWTFARDLPHHERMLAEHRALDDPFEQRVADLRVEYMRGNISLPAFEQAVGEALGLRP